MLLTSKPAGQSLLASFAQYMGESTHDTMNCFGPIAVERTVEKRALLFVVLTQPASARKAKTSVILMALPNASKFKIYILRCPSSGAVRFHIDSFNVLALGFAKFARAL